MDEPHHITLQHEKMYRTVRIILISVVLLLTVLAAGWAWLMTRDPVEMINWVLPAGSHASLAPDGSAVIDWGLVPRLDLSGLTISGPDGLPVAKADRLTLEISLPGLVRGVVYIRELSLIRAVFDGDGIQAIAASIPPSSPSDEPLRLPAILLQHAELDDVVLVLPDGKPGMDGQVLSLDRLTIAQPDDDSSRVVLTGMLDTPGGQFELAGDMASPARLFEETGVNLPLSLSLRQGEDHLSLEGRFGMQAGQPSLDATLLMDIADLSPVLQSLGIGIAQRLGIAGSAKLSGPMENPVLDDLAMLAGDGQSIVLDLAGRVDRLFQLGDMALEISAHIPPDLALHKLLPLPPDAIAHTDLTLRAKLTGDGAMPHLADVTMDMVGPHGAFSVRDGSARLAKDGMETGWTLRDLTADTTINLSDPRGLAIALGQQDPGIDSLQVEGLIRYDGQRIDLTARQGRLTLTDLTLGIAGTAGAVIGSQGIQPDTFDLSLDGAAQGRIALQRLGLGDAPIHGPYRLRAKASGRPEDFSLDGLNLDAAGPNGLSISLRGSIAGMNVGFDMARSRAHLQLHASSPNMTAFAELAGIEQYPAFGPTQLEATITGSPLSPAIGHIRMISGWPDGAGWVLAYGRINKLPLTRNDSLAGVDLTLLGEIREEEALTALVGARLPAIPPLPLRINAAVNDSGGKLALEDLVMVSAKRPGQLSAFALDGRIGDLESATSINLSARLEADLTPWIDSLGASREPGMPMPVEGGVTIADNGGILSVTGVDLVGTTPGEDLHIRGSMGDMGEIETLDARITFSVPTAERLNRFAGVALPSDRALTGDLTLAPRSGLLAISGSMSLGDSDAALDLTFGDNSGRPQLRGSVTSTKLALADFGLDPGPIGQGEADGTAQPSEAASPPISTAAAPPRPDSQPAFSDTPYDLSALRSIDLDLQASIATLLGKSFTLNDSRAKLRLDQGRLEITEMGTRYEGGHAEGGAVLDASGEEARIDLNFDARAMHLERVLAQLTERVSLTGRSDLKLDLQAHGNSPLGLARTARGDATMAIGAGSVNTSTARLLSQNLFGWLFTGGALGSRVGMECTMLRMTVSDGLADLDRFAMVLDNAILLGEGKIDLPMGQVNLTFVPRARRGLASTPTTLRATGPWEAPNIGPSDGAIPLKLAGDVLLAPLQLLGTLLPFLGGESRNPCISLQPDSIPPSEMAPEPWAPAPEQSPAPNPAPVQ